MPKKKDIYRHVPTGDIVEVTSAGDWIHFKNITRGTQISKPYYVFKQFYTKV